MRLFTCESIFALATFGLLGMMAALVWLSDPGIINAQSSSVFIVEGKVLIDGRPAPNGTKLIAFIDGYDAGEIRTIGGTFVLALPRQPGQLFAGRAIEFEGETADGRRFDFPQKTIWRPGGRAFITLETFTGFPSVDTEPHPPWVVQGKVMIDGHPAPDRTLINAFVGRERIAGTRTSGNAFVLSIPEPQGRSLSGVSIEFNARTDDGRGFRFPQTFPWEPGVNTSIVLEFPGGPEPTPDQPFSPFSIPNFPIPQVPHGLDMGCVIKILGRMPAGPQDMSPSESIRVAQNCFNGGGPQDDSARLEQERAFQEEQQRLETQRIRDEQAFRKEQQRLESERIRDEQAFRKEQQRLESERLKQERAFEQEQQRLDAERMQRDQDRIKREQALQEEQDRLNRDRLKSERERQQEQARLDSERLKQDQERFKAEQEMQLEQQRLDQRRAREEQQRQEELEKARFESERARIERERSLEEERARLDQERLKREDERLRREAELRQGQGQDGQPPGVRDPNRPLEGDPGRTGPTRGFFSNTRVGGLGAANQLMDPTKLAVLGILITMGATLMQMVKGS